MNSQSNTNGCDIINPSKFNNDANKQSNHTEIFSQSKSSSVPQKPSRVNVTIPEAPGKEILQDGYSRFLGIFLALTAAFMFSISALIIKVLNYHPLNFGVWRFAVISLIPFPFLVRAVICENRNFFKDIWPIREKCTTVFLVLQGIFGANAILLIFYGIKYLNIGDCSVIGNSAPIFVTLFAFLCLGEQCGVFPVLTTFLALIGVAIISKPPVLTGAQEFNEDTMIGVLSSFGNMLCLTVCYILIRYLRHVHHTLINLFFGLWGLLQSVVLANVMNVLRLPQSYDEVTLIIISAVLAYSAQTCVTLALKYEHAGPVALVRTTEVIFAFIWQAFFLGVAPDWFR